MISCLSIHQFPIIFKRKSKQCLNLAKIAFLEMLFPYAGKKSKFLDSSRRLVMTYGPTSDSF